MPRRAVVAACCAITLSSIAAPATKPAAIAPAAPGATPLQPASKPATQPAGAELPWLNSLRDGVDDAQANRRPIVVEVGAVWCGWCRELDKQIILPDVQKRLAKYTRVRLDLDKDTETVRTLAVGPVPALRILSPLGRVIATRDGYQPAAELIKWLDDHFEQASAAGEAVGDEPTDAAEAGKLVARITDADPVVREAVTRRLIRRPDLAAEKTVEIFAAGTLATRLAALELLEAWEAPIDAIDPWVAATVTPERLDALRKWGREQANAVPGTQPATKPAELTGDALAMARRDLSAMLSASGDIEARAARERLARAGPALLPHVQAAIKNAATDRDRQRLVALRYRLAASDKLAIAWPAGFDRLASPQSASRHAALEELATRATPNDSPLLLELFTDPDPLVRERSLSLLKAMGGNGMTAGLVQLLKDPEANVRAAVLKKLAESPVPGLDKDVAEFIKTEKDTDLVVHAARVLREAKTPTAVAALMSLLSHESWRVRAEAAESLGTLASNYQSPLSLETKADVYNALVKLLDDPDGFVVSKAMAGLRTGNVASAVEPMMAAADKRPELAVDVIKILTGTGKSVPASSIRHLRRFCGNASPRIRAVALEGLCKAAPADCDAELKSGLADAESSVRTAAARAAIELLTRSRPGQSDEERFAGRGDAKKPDLDKWLADFRAGKGTPKWAADAIPLFDKMIAADRPAEERLQAAVVLTALGQDAKSLPVIRKAVADSPSARVKAFTALEWLPWDARVSLYNELHTSASREERLRLIYSLTTLPNPAAGPILWNLLGDDGGEAQVAGLVHRSLIKAYTGDDHFYSGSEGDHPEAKVKPLVDAARDHAAAGNELQRVVALAVLSQFKRDEVGAAARKLIDDASMSEPLRADALKILLGSLPTPQAEPVAIEFLKRPVQGNWEPRKVAVRFLATGGNGISMVRDSIYLQTMSFSGYQRSSEVIKVTPPAGLTADLVRPMVADTDVVSAASAAYLMTIAGDPSALPTLVNYWRGDGQKDDEFRRLVYRAIAFTGDDAHVPTLEMVYESMKNETYYVSEFYWTIRPMPGELAMKLRKRMREELGARALQ